MAYKLDIVVNEFKFQSHYHVYFWSYTLGKGMNLLVLPLAMGKIVSLLFFFKDGFYMPLKKETKGLSKEY